MDSIFTYSMIKDLISRFYDYDYGKYFIDKIDSFDILEESDIVFPKYYKINNELLELYVFKLNKIYIISFDERDNEIIKFKLISKNDINTISFSVNCDEDYGIAFSFKDTVMELKACDVSKTYTLCANNTLKEIIKYFN